jgi:NSS family neurotransmitter:Na+ symporter
VAIGAMPAGQLVGVVFFLLLFIAAITSCVGLLEPLAARVRHWFDVRLSTATVIMSVLVALVSVGSVLSFNRWAEFHPLETFGVLADQTIYVVQDYVAVNIFLPLGALLMALFVGWFASKDIWREQLATSARIFAVCWLPVMRFVVPPAIASIMVISMLG